MVPSPPSLNASIAPSLSSPFPLDDMATLTPQEIALLINADIHATSPSALVMHLPRRRHAATEAQQKAQEIANCLSPEKEPLQAIIAYDKLIVNLRGKYIQQQKDQERNRKEAKGYTLRERVRQQGPYDPEKHDFKTPAAVPMPVKVATKDDLKPFFDYLKSDIPFQKPQTEEEGAIGLEPNYAVELLEFNRGVIYADHRMDLCKMVVGPNHIEDLMSSLAANSRVHHFLLGNNIIGRAGALAIAKYLENRPTQIQTWYLAGNMLDASSFKLIVDAAAPSQTIRSVWLKRNPLGPAGAESVCKLLIGCVNLITLDLDQTELSDEGCAAIFECLQSHDVALETIYLNGDGLGLEACQAIATYLLSPHCKLQNLYCSNNPIADEGAEALAHGLAGNQTIRRVSLNSCGIGSRGAIALTTAVVTHPYLFTLDLGQSFATKDLGSFYNYIEGADACEAIVRLINQNKVLRYLNLGVAGFTSEHIQTIGEAVVSSKLHHFLGRSCHQRDDKAVAIARRLASNVEAELGVGYLAFRDGHGLRFLRSPPDVRVIDSVYRNRDAGLARRKELVLKKFWDDGDDTMEQVQTYTVGPDVEATVSDGELYDSYGDNDA